ncbi:hypothetical protein BOX15_Mlig010604g1 [Macrostomum lignano]|uniref:SH3 domain-containing protein n=1 Tax=Macrostomum lignano TaxID=282301 RepID=A0A267F6R4_9PLAT|nr:hypothetical protein BOX15_Mlig010604g1 [Macrostomum lignano]
MSTASTLVNGGGGSSGGGSVTELSLAELRDIAARQQARIDAQLNDLRHRQLALNRLRKDSNGLTNGGGLAAAVEDRDNRLNRLRLQRKQLDEYRQANAQLAAQLAQARDAFQRRSEELAKLDQRVEAMQKLAESRQQQQLQHHQQPHQHPTLPSPDSRLARLREAVLQRRQQSEQLRLKATATTGASATKVVTDRETAVGAERPPSPPASHWHRHHHAPRNVIIASACRRGGQLPAEAAAATAQRYREAARLAYEAAAAKEQLEQQQKQQQQQQQQQQNQQQQQQAVSLTTDGIEDLIRLEASANPEEKRRSLVVVQDPPGAPIGWRAPIARPDDEETASSSSANVSAADASSTVDNNINSNNDSEPAAAVQTGNETDNDKLDDKPATTVDSNLSDDKKKKLINKSDRSVAFDPLTVLLDAAMEGDPSQIRACVSVDISASNEEGITALHNAVCAGHTDCVKLLIELGADVNSADIDGWTPLHCSVSCNHLALTQLLVRSGAAIYCATRADFETPLDLCHEGGAVERFLLDEAGKLGKDNEGRVYAVADYQPERSDELALRQLSQLLVVRGAEPDEPDWFWCRDGNAEGYAPKSLLSLYPLGGAGASSEEADRASSA